MLWKYKNNRKIRKKEIEYKIQCFGIENIKKILFFPNICNMMST